MKRRTGFVYKRGSIYYACFEVGGVRHRVSTKKKTKSEAQQFLNKKIEPFVAGDEVAVLQNLSARIAAGIATAEEAEASVNPPTSLVQAWKAYLKDTNRPDSGPATLSTYEYQFSAFVSWMKRSYPEKAHLRDVTEEIAMEYAGQVVQSCRHVDWFHGEILPAFLMIRTLTMRCGMAACIRISQSPHSIRSPGQGIWPS